MFEDSRVNIMKESLAVFEDIVKNPLFKSTPIYVFLNKKDIFEVREEFTFLYEFKILLFLLFKSY